MVANYAIEDSLSEAVVVRCFAHSGIEAGTRFGGGGFGRLKKMAPALNKSAKGIPYLMLTDLDRGKCAPRLVGEWLGGETPHPDFLLRVAVREVEAWLLADFENFAEFLGIAQAVLPRDFESLADPKLELLKAARRSRYRRIREDIVAESGHGPVQGPDYNGALSKFVTDSWEVTRAATRSPSLMKMLINLERLRERSTA